MIHNSPNSVQQVQMAVCFCGIFDGLLHGSKSESSAPQSCGLPVIYFIFHWIQFNCLQWIMTHYCSCWTLGQHLQGEKSKSILYYRLSFKARPSFLPLSVSIHLLQLLLRATESPLALEPDLTLWWLSQPVKYSWYYRYTSEIRI